MQLAKNNNAVWRVISDGDQPLPHLLRLPDLNKYQESQFRAEKGGKITKKKTVIFLKKKDIRSPEARTNRAANKVNFWKKKDRE